MNLSPTIQKYILHWGEMGTRWGINRTVAQIHALLFISKRPLPADEIAATLGIARSNVSNSLRELQNWGIIRVVHLMGDRRDHFESMKDVFEMFRKTMTGRGKVRVTASERQLDAVKLVLPEAAACQMIDSNTQGNGEDQQNNAPVPARHAVNPRVFIVQSRPQWRR